MKIVVIDDDPTGSQTVHDCPLLLSWETSVLRDGLRQNTSLLFVLANTRALLATEAAKRIKDICCSLKQAMREEGISLNDIWLVSRGDSTLRGHGVLEPKVIAEEFGPIDATFHIPAFFQGGRTTVNGVHLLDGVPVHLTPFAADLVFGYETSDLALWLQEKSQGLIDGSTVKKITLAQLDSAANSGAGMHELTEFLKSLRNNDNVVVDALRPEQLDALAEAIQNIGEVKSFLFRTAASFLNSLSQLPVKILHSSQISRLRRRDLSGNSLPGLILVGSHVSLTDIQLDSLLQNPECKGVELSVIKVANLFNSNVKASELEDFELSICLELEECILNSQTPVLYTSRGELVFEEVKNRLEFGYFLARLMSRIARSLAPRLGYMISKGGITTHVLLREGLGLDSVTLKGQILPGLSIVLASKIGVYGNLPIVTFPGNLGKPETLANAWRIVDSC